MLFTLFLLLFFTLSLLLASEVCRKIHTAVLSESSIMLCPNL